MSAVGIWLWKRKYWLLLGGLAVCLLLLAMGGNDAHQIRISYVYQGAENGLYPDGQRLLRDDLIATERVEEALAAMRAKGWYTDITAKQIRDNLSVREYLSNPVQEKVQALRAEGKEYTYYNNEFIISFVQPTVLHLKDSSDFFGLTRADRGKEFVDELLRAVSNAFVNEHTEGEVFADLCQYMQAGDADYDSVINICTDNAQLCITYLKKMKDSDSTFVSPTTKYSFDDLITGYQSLIDVQIARLSKYTYAEKISRRLQERIFRFQVAIENLRLTQKKQSDDHDISKGAMLEYDHTFSENIIIVSVNEENGLYQARPKTAYDTVTQRALNAGVSASVASNTADDDERLIAEYTASMAKGQDVEGKLKISEDMVDAIHTEYNRLAKVATATIVDYVDQTNGKYIQTSAVAGEGVSLTTLIKWGICFGAGMCVAALVCYLCDRRRNKKAAKG